MESPILFSQCNAQQRPHMIKILEDYAPTLSDTSNADNILDVGCGVGDFTRSVLMSYFKSYRYIVGIDVSEEAIQFARENYHHEKIEYEVLDIEGDIKQFREKWGSFSRIVSFLCMHYIDDWGKAFSNISELLSSNGECLLYFITGYDVYQSLLVMADSAKWNQYLMGIKDAFKSMHDTWDPYKECQPLFDKNDMVLLKCEEMHHETWLDDIDSVKRLLQSTDKFIHKMPKEDQELYLDELVNNLISNFNLKRNYNGRTRMKYFRSSDLKYFRRNEVEIFTPIRPLTLSEVEIFMPDSNKVLNFVWRYVQSELK